MKENQQWHLLNDAAWVWFKRREIFSRDHVILLLSCGCFKADSMEDTWSIGVFECLFLIQRGWRSKTCKSNQKGNKIWFSQISTVSHSLLFVSFLSFFFFFWVWKRSMVCLYIEYCAGCPCGMLSKFPKVLVVKPSAVCLFNVTSH